MRSEGVSRSTRRRFLDLLGATTVGVSLAGCTGDDDADDTAPNDDDDAHDDDDDDDDDADDDPIDVLAGVTITQEEFLRAPDPHDHFVRPYFNIFDHVYEPIFTITPELEFEPGLVREWENVDGGAELTIREDAVFHDGSDIRATDVAYSYNRQVDPAHSIRSAQASRLTTIRGAEALDEVTVFVEYDVAPSLAQFEYASYGRVVPAAFFEEHGHPIAGDDETSFNGNGPMEVVQYEPGEAIVLEPFEAYWGDPVPFDSVTFNAISAPSDRASALRDGETDFIADVSHEDVDAVDEDPDLDIRAVTSLRTVFLVMKSGVAPFDRLEFRQAMNYAVDNRDIVETIMSGFAEPAAQPVGRGIFGFNPDLDPYDQDIAMAEELVELSGYGGVDLTLHTPEGPYRNDAAIAEAAAAQIDELENVDCDVEVVPFDAVVGALLSGFEEDDLPFHLFAWEPITGDANDTLARFFVEDALFESMRDEELSEAIVHSQHLDDLEAREGELREINAALHERAPWVFLHNPERIYGIDTRIDWAPRADGRIYAWEMS